MPFKAFILKPSHAWRHRECRRCGHIFKVGDEIVRNRDTNRSVKYYCTECADFLNIVWEEPNE